MLLNCSASVQKDKRVEKAVDGNIIMDDVCTAQCTCQWHAISAFVASAFNTFDGWSDWALAKT